MQCYNNDHYFLGLLCLLVKVIDEVQKRFWLDKLSPWYVYSHPAAWKTISIYAKLQKLRPYPAEERTKSVTSHTRMLTTGRDMGKRCEQSEDRFQITRRTHSVHSKNHMAELTDLSRNSFQCVPTRASVEVRVDIVIHLLCFCPPRPRFGTCHCSLECGISLFVCCWP